MIALLPNGLADLNLRRSMARTIAFALDYCTDELGNVDYAWAADELGVDRSTLYRWRKACEAGREVRLALVEREAV